MRKSLFEPSSGVPDPLDSEEQWRTHYHLDLVEMSRFELGLALANVVSRLAQDESPDPWFVERHAAIERRLRHEG